jgi:hypothetical protein
VVSLSLKNKLQFHHEAHEEHEDETLKDLPLFLYNYANNYMRLP